MKALGRRLDRLEGANAADTPKPWTRIICEVGETVESTLARHRLTADDNVIVRQIIEPRA